MENVVFYHEIYINSTILFVTINSTIKSKLHTENQFSSLLCFEDSQEENMKILFSKITFCFPSVFLLVMLKVGGIQSYLTFS